MVNLNRFCYVCASPLEFMGNLPMCPVHGPLWRLVMNNPAADALVVRGGKVLLIERAHEPFKGYWASPGGHIESGETPAAAAVREAKEETGMDVHLDFLLGVYLDHIEPGHVNQVTVYVASSNDEPELSDETTNVGWFSVDDLPDKLAPWMIPVFEALRLRLNV